MKRPKRSEMIAQAIAWLDSGLLKSTLPGKLMREFDLSPGTAKTITMAAFRQRRQDREKRQDRPG